VGADGAELARGVQRAHGTTACEALAAAALPAPGAARGGTAYLNLETGDCVGDRQGLDALLGAGVARVVVGLRHPLLHWRGRSVAALRAAGVRVAVLSEEAPGPGAAGAAHRECLGACLRANDSLLVRARRGRPLSLLKYAMTLDGKIATRTGHAAWVSSPESRARVFEQRANADAVIVGGNTVRRDDPRLTTRRDGGHMPARVVLTRTLDLQPEASLWDTSAAPTIVMTQRGARRDFQAHLRSRGVEVVEFDFLDPSVVVAYLHDRGYLRLFWECGGTLSAPAIQAGVVDKVMAFVAPKVIGGVTAPTPVGDLGFVEMTQALEITEGVWSASGPDMMLEGYLSSTVPSLAALDEELDALLAVRQARAARGGAAGGAGPSAGPGPAGAGGDAGEAAAPAAGAALPGSKGVAEFYKACDEWGALTNFSPHPVRLALEGEGEGEAREWRSVEHYYQASKFHGVAGSEGIVEAVWAAGSPEEAARIGRRAQRGEPGAVRPGWEGEKVGVMVRALRAKFAAHRGPRDLLLRSHTAGAGGTPLSLAEGSPHDSFWGRGRDGRGRNELGRLLMELRAELVAEAGAVGEGELVGQGAGAP